MSLNFPLFVKNIYRIRQFLLKTKVLFICSIILIEILLTIHVKDL